MVNTRYHTKDNGQSYAELEYDVWGNPTSPGMLLNNDNGVFITAVFTGHIYDTVLDIYFAEARFLDAKNRQWLSSDPMKDGLNWYQYVGSNPATWVDPSGLFGENSVLRIGDKGGDKHDDIINVQTRLISLGILSADDVQYGVFDSNMRDAVIRFARSKPIFNISGTVDAEVWQALGFKLSGGQTYTDALDSNVEYRIGIAYARYLLDNLLIKIHEMRIKINQYFGFDEWAFGHFTLGNEYFQRIQCLINNKEGWKKVNTVADLLLTGYESWGDAVQYSGGQPMAQAFITVAIFASNYIQPDVRDPTRSDAIDWLIDDVYDHKIEAAKTEFAKLYETNLYYVLSDRTLKKEQKDLVNRMYISQIAEIIIKVRNDRSASTAFNANKARSHTIGFLESVIHFSMNSIRVKEALKF